MFISLMYPPPIVMPTAAPNTNKNDHVNAATVQLSRVDMFNALDLLEQDNELTHPYITFSATEATPTQASTQMEKGT